MIVEVIQKIESRAHNAVIIQLVEEYLYNNHYNHQSNIILQHQLYGHLQDHVDIILLDDNTNNNSNTNNNTIIVYRLRDTIESNTDLIDDDDDDDNITDNDNNQPTATHTLLPCLTLVTTWETLIYDDNIKQQLLRYAETALYFTDKNISHDLISWNRLILLHGPPGTGKTALCRALAQKLSIRLRPKYTGVRLIEIDSHSLFSRWFSESGKAVAKLFTRVKRLLDDGDELVCLLIDEVESLAGCRSAALAGTEPSDSMRAVNALLTQLDVIRRRPNVLILATSNVTGAIDAAFADRADLKKYIGPPIGAARYEILRSSMLELARVGVIDGIVSLPPSEKAAREDGESVDGSALLRLSEKSAGLSGRTLRKIPFLARALYLNPSQTGYSFTEYANAMEKAVEGRSGEDRLYGEKAIHNGHRGKDL